MKKYSFLAYFWALALIVSSCAKIAPAFTKKSSANTLSSIYVTFADGSGGFSPTTVAPYDSVITINIPWYYPDGSYNETSLDSLLITGTLPNSSYLNPAFGLVNLTAPKIFTVTAQNGSKQSYKIQAVRKKSSNAEITSFKLKEADISCVIAKNNVIIPYTGSTDLSSQTAQVELSNYATISPDPTVPRNYTDSVLYTVTAQDGTQQVYTVKKGIPVKLDKGFGSVKELWNKSAGDLNFDDYLQISIAVSGNYLVVPTSNEWVGGSTIKYYDRKAGNYVGNLNVTGVNGIYSIANDINGKIVGINNLYAGNNVCLYEWDNVNAAPKLLARSTDWSSVASAFYGRKISIYGDITSNAVIMASTDGTNAGGANNILRWTVKNGQLVSQDPEVINYGVAFGYVAKPVPTDVQSTGNYFFCSNYPSFMHYVSASSNTKLYEFPSDYIANPRGFTPALTYFTFNNANYAAIADINVYSGAMHIFDVTDPANIITSSSSPSYAKYHVFDGESSYIACPSPNYNGTAEIAYGPVSSDGYTMDVYFLLTNGGIAAYELNCIDLSKY